MPASTTRSSTPTAEERSTAERLLTQADRLFRERDYDRVTIRAVTSAAGTNIAAVNYHFGSRDGLVVALLEQRLTPRWPRLGDLRERRAAGWCPTVRDVVDIVFRPLLDLAADPDDRTYLHLLTKVGGSGRRPRWNLPGYTAAPWLELLADARPDLNQQELTARWTLAGTLVVQVCGQDPRSPLSAVDAGTLLDFVAAGLDAPVGH